MQGAIADIFLVLIDQVSLVNYERHRHNSGVVTAMSWRVRPSHQKQGISKETDPAVFDLVHRHVPNLTDVLYVAEYAPHLDKTMKLSTILYRCVSRLEDHFQRFSFI